VVAAATTGDRNAVAVEVGEQVVGGGPRVVTLVVAVAPRTPDGVEVLVRQVREGVVTGRYVGVGGRGRVIWRSSRGGSSPTV
jgi:hypothetical protein